MDRDSAFYAGRKVAHSKLGYIEAAKSIGLSDYKIILRHALPNALTPILITLAFGIASSILLEASLSFLDLGAGVDEVTWGRLLMDARQEDAIKTWWLAVFPGLYDLSYRYYF